MIMLLIMRNLEKVIFKWFKWTYLEFFFLLISNDIKELIPHSTLTLLNLVFYCDTSDKKSLKIEFIFFS